jgi:hypothetical protein
VVVAVYLHICQLYDSIFDRQDKVHDWSKDLVVCTNGKIVHSTEQKELLQNKGIKIIELKIKNFIGQNGHIEQLVFENGETVSRKGGFVLTQ